MAGNPQRPALGRVFAPADDLTYVIAISPGKPFLVIDRQTGTASIVDASKLDTLIGPPTSRARSLRMDAVVGLVTFPDDRYLVVVGESATKPVASERGMLQVPYITKVVFLALKPPSGGEPGSPGGAGGEDPYSPEASLTALSAKQRGYLKDFLEAGDAGAGEWLTPLMQGNVCTEQVLLPGDGVLTASLVARRSCEHAGTRLKTRGINDSGAAANCVELEQILHMKLRRQAVTSLVQIRGSVPVFWEQRTKLGTVNPKPRVSRVTELTTPALREHLDGLQALYGKVIVLSLLDQRGDETELATALATCLEALEERISASVRYAAFDFHHAAKATSRGDACRTLLQRLSTEHADAHPAAHGYFAMRVNEAEAAAGTESTTAPVSTQRGIVRTNCLDCLNRTNMAQTVLGLQSATAQLRALGTACELPAAANTPALETNLHAALRKLWTEAGDVISVQYTGTSNLSKGSGILGEDASEKKKSLFEKARGAVEKGVKTAQRFVNEQFLEDTRQAAIDTLLGAGSERLRRVSSAVGGAEAAGVEPVTLLVGTWNNNGKVGSADEVQAWLQACSTKVSRVPPSDESARLLAEEPPGVCILGFQEFVSLDAKNLMLKDHEERRRECRARVLAVLQDLHGERYVEVGAEQMFGVFLLVYVRPRLAAFVRGVHAEVVKLGFGSDSLGIKAGNKGGLAVRLDLFGASVCFINSHLPAGQSHPEERNETYHEILKGPNEEVRRIVADAASMPAPQAAKELQAMLQYDQLTIAKASGAAFDEFVEAPLEFAPTYKYDAGTQVYDTSEKARVPSWTDRVLWREGSRSEVKQVACLAYDSANSVLVSDHKPVAALLLWNPGKGKAALSSTAAPSNVSARSEEGVDPAPVPAGVSSMTAGLSSMTFGVTPSAPLSANDFGAVMGAGMSPMGGMGMGGGMGGMGGMPPMGAMGGGMGGGMGMGAGMGRMGGGMGMGAGMVCERRKGVAVL
ncbi:synaptojanin-1 isoform 1 [Chrysochromulina tobinii]|uniref:phosphoinositide 5-phosphatase n=1 Tax=Chrysochromulina tobinii TaxID=1460289 RepID=A0A0M0K941_9EUKA|nr:synaptojanin-1 isoform 1 [Chrysochromulina tobinii]|eukprot:KOO34913.1 synaptojanin-1 isoform 1 [Chrysochromulina sp. CCMP291]